MEGGKAQGAGEPQTPEKVKAPSLRSRLFSPTAASKARQSGTPVLEPGIFVDLSKSSAELAGPSLLEPKANSPGAKKTGRWGLRKSSGDDKTHAPSKKASAMQLQKSTGGGDVQGNGSSEGTAVNGHANGLQGSRSEGVVENGAEIGPHVKVVNNAAGVDSVELGTSVAKNSVAVYNVDGNGMVPSLQKEDGKPDMPSEGPQNGDTMLAATGVTALGTGVMATGVGRKSNAEQHVNGVLGPETPTKLAAKRSASPARKTLAKQQGVNGPSANGPGVNGPGVNGSASPRPSKSTSGPLARTNSSTVDRTFLESPRGRSSSRSSPLSSGGKPLGSARGLSPGSRGSSPGPSPRQPSPTRTASALHSLSAPTLSSLSRQSSGDFSRASPRSVLQSGQVPGARSPWVVPTSKSQVLPSTRKALGMDSEGSSSSSENGNAANRRWSTGSRKTVAGLAKTGVTGAGELRRTSSIGSMAGLEDLKVSPNLKLDLKGKRLRKLSGAALSPKLEWVSLRDNKLQTLEGIEILKRVKVLNLAANELKSKALAALRPLQSLQQLFLSNNQLTTLATLPSLPSLSFLSVIQNEIMTLEMPSLPRLQTLVASRNYIASLKDLPQLPALMVLKVDDNPVAEDPLARTVAMLLVGKTLQRFNEEVVGPADHFAALAYPPHMAECLRGGFALTTDNNSPEHLAGALLDVQTKAGLPPGYTLASAIIAPPCEGSLCTAAFEFEYTGHEAKRAPLQKRYQWLRGSRHDVTYDVIEGATSASYVPGPEDVGLCLRVECTPTLGGIAFPPVFAVSVEVAEGSGVPVIADIQIDGEPVEGKTLQGHVHVSWNGAKPGRKVVSWWRCQDPAHPFTIPDAVGPEYTLSAKDIGHSVWFMCLPMAADGTKGEAQFAETAVVQPDAPRVVGVRVVGPALTGKKLTAEGTYRGGLEGGSVLEWFSQDPATGALTDLQVPNNSREYTPTDTDVGRKIVFRFTPVNSEGLVGEPISASTASPVESAPPEIADMSITGSLMEGGKVVVSYRYVGGGVEGKTRIQWLKSKYPKLYGNLGDSAVIELGGVTTDKELAIPVDAIGWYLGAKVTPVRGDDVAAAPVYVAAAEPIVLRPPSVMGIRIDGSLVCGETVMGSYEYAGGKEGYSQMAWYLHQDEADPGTLIQGSIGQRSRLLTRKEVGKFLSFRCTPRRADGAEGQTQSALSQERVKPFLLKVAKLSVSGVHMEGEALSVQHHVPDEPEHREDWGGYLQEMTYQWYRSEPGSRSTFAAVPAATSSEYRATIDDVGRILRCEGRARDAFGRLSDPVHVFSGQIEPAPPSVTDVRLEGEAESGAVLRGLGEFSGGAEGASRFEWFRQDYTDGALYPLHVPNNSPEYVIPESEAGRRIVFKYTPISTEGKVGIPGFATSPIIELAAPKVSGLAIVGSLLEGSRVSVIGQYSGGGKEGQSEVRWFRSRDGGVGSSMEALPQFDGRKEFIIPAEVVDLHLIAKYTPIRIDGERGEPSFVTSKTTVQSLPPSVVSIHLEGEMQAGTTITAEYKYVGGLEGVSHYGWYLHESPNAPGNLIPGSVGLRERLLTRKEVGKFLSFSVTPRRKDGVEGETKSFVSKERIMPEPLQLQGVSISGEPVEGETLTAVPALPADREEWDRFKKEIRFQWFRSVAIGSSEFVPMSGETSSTYSPTFEDIGRRMRCECCVIDNLDRRSRPVTAVTEPVEAGAPSIRNVTFDGKHVAGCTIRGVGSYFGGTQGASRYEWFRENIRTGEFDPIHVPNNSPEYQPGPDDVGRRIMFKYTPINAYGKAGETVTVTSDPVKPAPPRIVDLSIRGTLTEGSTVTVHAFYVGGGEEGLSRIQWYRSRSPSTGGNDLVEIGPVQTRRDLVVPSEAVGWYLLAIYTPVRSDGEAGESVQTVSARPVSGLPPSITAIQLSGSFVEGETLRATYEYAGGYEGNSVYGWYLHENEQDPGALIPGSVGLKERLLTKRDVGKLISFKCTPRREEGLEGPSRTAMSPDRVAAALPACERLRIEGSPVENAVLRAEKDYVGGYEGASIYRWYVTQPGEVQKRIEGASGSTYKLRSEDIDCMISVACTPVRIDGVNGDQVWASPVGPIIGGRPFVGHLEILGRAREGEVLTVQAAYKGGKKGACNIVWHRIDPSGAEAEIGKEETVVLTREDIGCRIRAAYTPIRADGIQGDEMTATTDVVIEGEPTGMSLKLTPLQENQETAPAYVYSGGSEGSSEWGWYRSSEDPQSSGEVSPDEMSISLLKVGSTKVYKPTVNDVGHWLLVRWTPMRSDGRRGMPISATSAEPVAAGEPEVSAVTVIRTGELTLEGSGVYRGGKEGMSQYSWQRQLADGTRELILGACDREYTVTDDDFGHELIFGYIPVRADGESGLEKLSAPAAAILPPLLVAGGVGLKGKAEEREILGAVVTGPENARDATLWERFMKEVQYKWYRLETDGTRALLRTSNINGMYKARFEDVGRCLECECTVIDIWGRSSLPMSIRSALVEPGLPLVERVRVYGRELHSGRFQVKGNYSGGVEGASTFQWFRAIAGSWQLTPIPGADGQKYQANVDDIGFILAAKYTPVREDGLAGEPVTAQTNPIALDADVARDVTHIVDQQAAKFDVMMATPQGLQARTIDANGKRLKINRAGTRTGRSVTETKANFKPPFWVEISLSDPYKAVVILEEDKMVEVVLPTWHERDVFAMVLRKFAQKFR